MKIERDCRLRVTTELHWAIVQSANLSYYFGFAKLLPESKMELSVFKSLLASHPEHQLRFSLPNRESLAPHFHITEVGKVTKDFVDCGGTRRTAISCVLQTLVANDVEHRLKAGKLSEILEKSSVLNLEEDLDVELEVQMSTISVFSVNEAHDEGDTLHFALAEKSTACLAPDRCGIELSIIGEDDCSGNTGCC